MNASPPIIPFHPMGSVSSADSDLIDLSQLSEQEGNIKSRLTLDSTSTKSILSMLTSRAFFSKSGTSATASAHSRKSDEFTSMQKLAAREVLKECKGSATKNLGLRSNSFKEVYVSVIDSLFDSVIAPTTARRTHVGLFFASLSGTLSDRQKFQSALNQFFRDFDGGRKPNRLRIHFEISFTRGDFIRSTDQNAPNQVFAPRPSKKFPHYNFAPVFTVCYTMDLDATPSPGGLELKSTLYYVSPRSLSVKYTKSGGVAQSYLLTPSDIPSHEVVESLVTEPLLILQNLCRSRPVFETRVEEPDTFIDEPNQMLVQVVLLDAGNKPLFPEHRSFLESLKETDSASLVKAREKVFIQSITGGTFLDFNAYLDEDSNHVTLDESGDLSSYAGVILSVMDMALTGKVNSINSSGTEDRTESSSPLTRVVNDHMDEDRGLKSEGSLASDLNGSSRKKVTIHVYRDRAKWNEHKNDYVLSFLRIKSNQVVKNLVNSGDLNPKETVIRSEWLRHRVYVYLTLQSGALNDNFNSVNARNAQELIDSLKSSTSKFEDLMSFHLQKAIRLSYADYWLGLKNVNTVDKTTFQWEWITSDRNDVYSIQEMFKQAETADALPSKVSLALMAGYKNRLADDCSWLFQYEKGKWDNHRNRIRPFTLTALSTYRVAVACLGYMLRNPSSNIFDALRNGRFLPSDLAEHIGIQRVERRPSERRMEKYSSRRFNELAATIESAFRNGLNMDGAVKYKTGTSLYFSRYMHETMSRNLLMAVDSGYRSDEDTRSVSQQKQDVYQKFAAYTQVLRPVTHRTEAITNQASPTLRLPRRVPSTVNARQERRARNT